MIQRIDLNADVGESFGAYRIGDDEALLNVVSSANVACGVHAGDALTAWRTLQMCVQRGVAVGAHIGHRDRYGFGRRELQISPEEAYAETLYQIGSLRAGLRVLNAPLHHVKPHGALYNQMAKDEALCRAVARGVRDFSHTLRLVVLAGSSAVVWAQLEGCAVIEEGFLDRGYAPNGSLLPRSHHRAVLGDPAAVAARALEFVRGEVMAVSGASLKLEPQTLCVHGDTPGAAGLARAARAALEAAGVNLEAF
jgi:5-oxoprolinase (ATP-hydrolysing) subunit A